MVMQVAKTAYQVAVGKHESGGTDLSIGKCYGFNLVPRSPQKSLSGLADRSVLKNERLQQQDRFFSLIVINI